MDVSKTALREFLEIPYEKLEELNLQSKAWQEQWIPMEKAEAERRAYLEKEKRIKAVTVVFSDLP
ncbi:glutamine synthetase, partial [bacterium]|nr:glutamine synthetase [bacterium]